MSAPDQDFRAQLRKQCIAKWGIYQEGAWQEAICVVGIEVLPIGESQSYEDDAAFEAAQLQRCKELVRVARTPMEPRAGGVGSRESTIRPPRGYFLSVMPWGLEDEYDLNDATAVIGYEVPNGASLEAVLKQKRKMTLWGFPESDVRVFVAHEYPPLVDGDTPLWWVGRE